MLRHATGIEFVHIAYKGGMPEAFGALIRIETEKWVKIVKRAGIRPEWGGPGPLSNTAAKFLRILRNAQQGKRVSSPFVTRR
ncbi:MAG: hypothetical protein AAB403_03195 [Planctomycetota bacterium]